MSRATSLVAREHELADGGRDSGMLRGAPGVRVTQLETELAQLASRGLSDREIAEKPVLSMRTVQTDPASAYRELGFASRSELKP